MTTHGDHETDENMVILNLMTTQGNNETDENTVIFNLMTPHSNNETYENKLSQADHGPGPGSKWFQTEEKTE